MSTLAASLLADPLTHDQAATADRVMRRLHEQIRSFLAGFPPPARNASGLARFLNVDRTTCQRLVYVGARPYAGLNAIDRMPGVRGLRQVIQAARKCRGGKAGISGELLEAFEAAVNRFDETLRALGGSQSGLIRRIAAMHADAPDDASSAKRDEPADAPKRLFDAAAEITGRRSETWVAVYVYNPVNGTEASGGLVDVARAHGLIGHRARPNAVPLTFHNFTSKRSEVATSDELVLQPFQNLNGDEVDGQTPTSVLREFSTDPLPVVMSRQPGEYLMQAIDDDPAASVRPIDLMLATRSTMPHPASQPPRIEEVWAMINFPVRQMVFDVYLHRDLARTCIPSLDVHLWRPDFTANVGDRWQTRFTKGPRLELLGTGISNAAAASYPRHAELTSYLFRRLALDSDRFIGFRCAVQYPLWRTGYCMSFDFNTGEDGPEE